MLLPNIRGFTLKYIRTHILTTLIRLCFDFECTLFYEHKLLHGGGDKLGDLEERSKSERFWIRTFPLMQLVYILNTHASFFEYKLVMFIWFFFFCYTDLDMKKLCELINKHFNRVRDIISQSWWHVSPLNMYLIQELLNEIFLCKKT